MATPGEPAHGSPTPPQLQTSSNTAHSAHRIASSTQQKQDLTNSAEAFYTNACRANMIPTDELIEAIYGKFDDLDDIRAILEEDRSLSDSGWQALYDPEIKSYLPSDSPLEEEKLFAGLTTIFARCSRAAGISTADCTVQLKVHGHASSNFPNGTRPDATIHLTESSLLWRRDGISVDHGDVCTYVQFRKKENKWNCEDDISKLLWNVHHRFRCDPCCRFVCGLTIENTSTRFWHFSRVGVMVSEPFDIITDADKPIHIFVSLARAKHPYNLGFDPTITCITTDPVAQRQYRIEVHNNKDEGQDSIDCRQSYTFTTRRVIADYGAVGIQAHGTRVFEGIEGEGPNATPVVIKDAWIDSDREMEGVILKNVRKTLEGTPEDLQLFLEPLCHGCVLVNGVKDVTQPLLKSSSTVWFYYSGEATTPSSRSESSRGYPSVMGALPKLPRQSRDRRGEYRRHYRIVFKGRPGRALRDLESYEEVFTALLGGVKALRALFRAGYIHRDLSVGNVLLVKQGEEKAHGVLIDLEYAQRYPCVSKDGRDDRTGTLRFMACEVDTQSFHFLPPPEAIPLILDEIPISYYSLSSHVTVPWFHNPIHDMESAWWIAVWSFCRRNDSVNRSLFSDNAPRRVLMLLVPGMFRNECTGIPEPVLNLLDAWLNFMRGRYMELEKLVSDDSHLSFNYNRVFDTVIKVIKAIITALPPDSTLATKELANSAEDSPNV